MNCKYDGGPAYPVVCDGDPCIILRSEGMSLRDYFAVRAMQAIINDDTIPTTAASWSYQYADAMLAQRKVSDE